MFDLNGKHALVTGASGGIGGAIAKGLKDRGAMVALSGTRVDALQALACKLGDGAHVMPADLSIPEGANQLIKGASEAMGGIDILVNNAGLTRDNLAMRIKNEDWETVIAVNLSATFRLSKAVLRGMMKERWGRIINVSSAHGLVASAQKSAYVAAKHGLLGLAKVIALPPRPAPQP